MMIVNINKKSQTLFSHLPDIVNDCEEKLQRQVYNSINDDNMKITCKQIAHSLRLVADQVDKKYCQVSFKNKFSFFLINNFSFLCLFRILTLIEIFTIYQYVLYFNHYFVHYGHNHYYHIFFFFAKQNHSCIKYYIVLCF